MKPETAGKIKSSVWGLICTAVIAIIIGFAWGGWTTFRTTQKMSKEAVLASQVTLLGRSFVHGRLGRKAVKNLNSFAGVSIIAPIRGNS